MAEKLTCICHIKGIANGYVLKWSADESGVPEDHFCKDVKSVGETVKKLVIIRLLKGEKK